MKLIGDKLYIPWRDLTSIGISEGTIKSAQHTNANGWNFIEDESDKRKRLIEFNGLADKYKEIVRTKLCGGLEPGEFLKSNQLRSIIKGNENDRLAIANYFLPNGLQLNQSDIAMYSRAAEYCYFLSKANLKSMKALGFQNAEDFYSKIISLIKSENLPLPHTYSNLKKKVKKYKASGAVAIISNRFGITNNCKINKLEQESYLRFFYKCHSQLRHTQIAFHYNIQAEMEGWPKVNEKTIANHIKVFKHMLAGARFGKQEFREANDFVVGRIRPSKPDLLWVGDATPFELYYKAQEKDSKGKLRWNYNKRVCVYLVIDAFNDYITGFSFGETETNQLARNAWTSACIIHNTMPVQIKTDNYGKKELGQFFAQIALNPDYNTPSAVGNARDKVIESVFAKLYDFIVRYFPNASGRNIRAKEQANRDYLETIKHSFPELEKVQQQIALCINEWNTSIMNRPGGVSREDQRNNADSSHKRLLTDMNRLRIFGRTHNYTCTQTNQGIVTTLGGVKRQYMQFTDAFADRIGTEYQIIYDPYDYSKILVQTKDERRRFLLEEFQPIPMAYADMKPGDRTRLNKALSFKERQFQRAIELQNNDDRILREHGMGHLLDDPEAILKARFSINGDQKQSLYEAENSMKAINQPEIVKQSSKQKSKHPEHESEHDLSTIYQDALNKKPRIINP